MRKTPIDRRKVRRAATEAQVNKAMMPIFPRSQAVKEKIGGETWGLRCGEMARDSAGGRVKAAKSEVSMVGYRAGGRGWGAISGGGGVIESGK